MGGSWGGELRGSILLACPCSLWCLGQTVSKHGPSCRNLSIVQPFGLAMWVSITSDAVCATALQQAVVDFGVVDTSRHRRSASSPQEHPRDCCWICLGAVHRPSSSAACSWEGTMTDTAVLKDTAVQTALADDVVDSKTAEAMSAENVRPPRIISAAI